IPDWVKANAFGWGNDQANDDVFIRGLEFMIKEKIIIIPENIQIQGEVAIPDWVKNPSTWWSEDKIDNETFVNVLEYLINKGIIKI
ncbi:MAG: peptidase, partial [Nitrosopumilaceae archaeon]